MQSEDGTITAAHDDGGRTAPRRFAGACQERRDLPVTGGACMCGASAWEDDFYLLQRRVWAAGSTRTIPRCICWAIQTRTPAKYTMTFRKGYNTPSLKQENLIARRVVPDNYEFGKIEIKSPCGNPIYVFDLERTLCDIVRGSGSDVQIVGEAMKRYAGARDKNIGKLMEYAERLRVKPKVLRYMEVLL